MTSKNALIFTVGFILWLLFLERRRARNTAYATWIPTLWALILGSRPVSNWFDLGVQMESADDYLEGSPFDRLLFLILIAVGFVVLARRGIHWALLKQSNKWLVAYYGFFLVSVLWSDYPFTAVKRWIKDCGNVIMALIIITDASPINAFRAVFARCLYAIVPMSVLLIRYFPEIGRSYNRFTYEPYNQGVTLFKNQLGMAVAICFVYLIWEMQRIWRRVEPRDRSWPNVANHLILFLMSVWLLHTAKSATSIVCSGMGAMILVLIRLPAVRSRVDRIAVYLAIGIPALYSISSVVDVTGLFFGMLGRDPSLTGRTDIWDLVLAEANNPLLGAGFYSFWTGERITKFWALYGVGMNQAHNGYLETYLIGGIVGVILLLGLLLSTGKKIKDRLAFEDDWGGVRIVFWLFAVVHNFTEASFSKVSLLWFILLMVMIDYPRNSALN